MKRQQAAEDAIAMGLRAVATGQPMNGYLPPGPIFGMPVTEPLKHDINENTNQNMLNSDSGDDGNESANESAEESDRNKSNEESSGRKPLFIQ